MKAYTSEAEGQAAFYPRLSIDPTINHNTDGVYRGTLFEHKLKINDTNKVLFQAIKYASRIRERGEPIPGQLILNDLNQEKAYLYQTADFINEVEQVYFGAASKDNDAFTTQHAPMVIDYSTIDGLQTLLGVIQSTKVVKTRVDRTNILGLADQFYARHPDKGGKDLKDKFLAGPQAEIRKPHILADRIHPYMEPGNEAFGDIMDALNPGALQRELGAYYTPPAYVAQMHKMLLQAIEEVPEGMDYLIIDRCAGVGNLERGLPPEILKHCVLSTLEPNEYQLLRHQFRDDCAVVVPNTDALAWDIIPANHDGHRVLDDFVREKVSDPNCVIILMENPPYSEVAGGSTQKAGKKANGWKKSLVCTEMAAAIKSTPIPGLATNDLANLFIWSAFRYYLTKPQDSYILFAPTKYWRNQHLADKIYRDGFLCNRKHFHATASTIGCMRWQNVPDTTTEEITIQAYDIGLDGKLVAVDEQHVLRKAEKNHSLAYDKSTQPTDQIDGVVCELNGNEFNDNGRKIYAKRLHGPDVIAYLNSSTFGVDAKHISLTRCAWAGGHGFFLRSNNFLDKLPLFVAAAFPINEWWKRDVYSKSYDGNGSYTQDQDFLIRCLFYTALTNKNKPDSPPVASRDTSRVDAVTV